MIDIQVAAAKITAFFAALPFSTASWFLFGVLAFFVWLFSKAQRNPNSLVDWEDLIIDHTTNRTSPYKLGYLIGMIVGTWVVVKFADEGKLGWDVFSGYLAYLVTGAGWITMTQSKANGGAPAAIPAPTAPKAPSAPAAPAAPAPAPKVDDVI